MESRNGWRALALSGAVGLAASCAPNRDVLITRTATTGEGAAVGTTSTTITTTTTGARPVSQDIGMSDALINACGIHWSSVDDAPRFDFDKFNLTEADRQALEQVARCVTTGALRGRSVALVGRADPRGEAEYILVLGENRASSVARFLGDLGVPPTQLSETSRGKLDAKGTDEASWALDRRVDLDLR